MGNVFVFSAHSAFAYRETEGEHKGMMLETSLSFQFTAPSYSDAIDSAIRWANNRFENVIKDSYSEAVLSSLKVRAVQIGPIDENGGGLPSSLGTFFEWKYDWPGTLEQYVASAKKKFK